MARPPIYPLDELIDRNKDTQNGFGYDEFARMLTLPKKKPSVNSIANIYNRNYGTVKRWFDRFEAEVVKKK